MNEYFEKLLKTINDSITNLNMKEFERLQNEMIETVRQGYSVIVSGLGKNVPICEKFVGTMQSLGMDASFLHTNSAVHGDLGCVHEKDLVILLTKSGETAESVYLTQFIQKKKANLWLMTFEEKSILTEQISKKLILKMNHEGDMWNLVPNNSTTIFLIILQALAIKTAEKLNIPLEQFKENHPGGNIGKLLTEGVNTNGKSN